MARKQTEYEKALETIKAHEGREREIEKAAQELEVARAIVEEKECADQARAAALEKVRGFIDAASRNTLTERELDALESFPEAMRKRSALDALYNEACDPSRWEGVPQDLAEMLDSAADAAPAVGINSPCLVLSRAASTVRGF